MMEKKDRLGGSFVETVEKRGKGMWAGPDAGGSQAATWKNHILTEGWESLGGRIPNRPLADQPSRSKR